MRSRVVEERKRERERSQCMRNDALLSFPWNRHPPPFPSRASNYEGEARGEIIRQMRSVAMTAKIRGPMKILNARQNEFSATVTEGLPRHLRDPLCFNGNCVTGEVLIVLDDVSGSPPPPNIRCPSVVFFFHSTENRIGFESFGYIYTCFVKKILKKITFIKFRIESSCGLQKCLMHIYKTVEFWMNILVLITRVQSRRVD